MNSFKYNYYEHLLCDVKHNVSNKWISKQNIIQIEKICCNALKYSHKFIEIVVKIEYMVRTRRKDLILDIRKYVIESFRNIDVNHEKILKKLPHLICYVPLCKRTPELFLQAIWYDDYNRKYSIKEDIENYTKDMDPDMVESLYEQLVDNYPHYLEHIQNPSHNLCVNLAKKYNPSIIRNINNLTEQLCFDILNTNIEYVKTHPEIIGYINIPLSENFQKELINFNPLFLEYIENQFDSVCELALSIDTSVCKFIKNKELLQKLLDVGKNGMLLEFVENQNEEICERAIIQNPFAIKYVKNKNRKLCLLAVKIDGMTLEHIKDQDNDICYEAVSQNGLALQFVKDKNDNICKKAVWQIATALKFVDNQNYEICMDAVTQNENAIKYVKEEFKDYDVCITALSHIPFSDKNKIMIILSTISDPDIIDKCLDYIDYMESGANRIKSARFV